MKKCIVPECPSKIVCYACRKCQVHHDDEIGIVRKQHYANTRKQE